MTYLLAGIRKRDYSNVFGLRYDAFRIPDFRKKKNEVKYTSKKGRDNMTIFNFYGGLCGCDKPFCAKIKLLENVDVAKGELLYYDHSTRSVTPEKGTIESIAGVCANTYKAEKNNLCPEHGEGFVSVILSKDALYATAPIVIENTYTGNTAVVKTSVAYSDAMSDSGLVGAMLMLAEKAENSQNSGSVGCTYEITAVTNENGKVSFTVDYNGNMTAGDKYILIPPYGFTMLGLDTDKNLCLADGGGFTVMDANAVGYVLGFDA